MANRINKLQAFTILEAVITLVISALLIAFVYQIYTGITLQFKNYAFEQEATIEYNHFSSVLMRDVSLCQSILMAENGAITLEFPKKIVSYRFLEEFSIRTAEKVDTFKVAVSEINYQTLNNNEHLNRESLSLKTNVLGRTIVVFESKELDIAAKINQRFANVN